VALSARAPSTVTRSGSRERRFLARSRARVTDAAHRPSRRDATGRHPGHDLVLHRDIIATVGRGGRDAAVRADRRVCRDVRSVVLRLAWSTITGVPAGHQGCRTTDPTSRRCRPRLLDRLGRIRRPEGWATIEEEG
jgi:hypothetical protein